MTNIRPMTVADWPQVEAIFAAGISGGEATFETTTPTWEQFDTGKITDARLVTRTRRGQSWVGLPHPEFRLARLIRG